MNELVGRIAFLEAVMWTQFDVVLVAALFGMFCFFGGVVIAVLVIYRSETIEEREIEKSGMWRIDDRAYRLVRSQGLDNVRSA